MSTPIDRGAWIKLSERKPSPQTICLITDGRDIGLGEFDTPTWSPEGWWSPVGCGGYDFEWDFAPTHWIPLSVELP